MNLSLSYLHNFVPQFGNLWRFGRADPKYGTKGYPGRCPGQQVKQLLWFYTNEGDMVTDPFAGGGTTLDVCNEWKRKCYVSDINPCRPDIEKRDVLVDGLPNIQSKLIILDPPYCSQVEYTSATTDLSQMSVDEYYKSMKKVGKECLNILLPNGRVVLIISTMRTGGVVYDLPFELYNRFIDVGYKLEERVCVGFEGISSQTGYWVSSARKLGYMLRMYKDQFTFVREDFDTTKEEFVNELSWLDLERVFK